MCRSKDKAEALASQMQGGAEVVTLDQLNQGVCFCHLYHHHHYMLSADVLCSCWVQQGTMKCIQTILSKPPLLQLCLVLIASAHSLHRVCAYYTEFPSVFPVPHAAQHWHASLAIRHLLHVFSVCYQMRACPYQLTEPADSISPSTIA